MMRTGTFSRCVASVLVLSCCLALVKPQAYGQSVLENRSLRLAATPGQPGVAVYFKAEGGGRRMELALLASGTPQSSSISKAEVVKSGSDRNSPHVRPRTSEAKVEGGQEDDQESVLRV